MFGVALFDAMSLSLPRLGWGGFGSRLKAMQPRERIGQMLAAESPVHPVDREGACRPYAVVADDEFDLYMTPGPSGYIYLSEDAERLIFVPRREVAYLPDDEKQLKEAQQLQSALYVNLSVRDFDAIATESTLRGNPSYTTRHVVDICFRDRLGDQISSEDMKWIAPHILGTRRAKIALNHITLTA